jgi:hypothetical protein
MKSTRDIETEILEAIKNKTYEILDNKNDINMATDKINIENLKLSKSQVDYIIDVVTKQIYLKLSRLNNFTDYNVY